MSSFILTQRAANTVVLRLTDKVTLTDPKFLFTLESSTRKEKSFIAQDISTHTEAYNKFIITEVASGSESLTTGNVNLQPTGQWNYTVRQQSSSSNLDPDSAGSVVGRGIVTVIPASDPVTYNEYDGQTDELKYYDPNE